jgi:hypothetical protein
MTSYHKRPARRTSEGHDAWFRLGLFGDSRSGKTVYLASLQLVAEAGGLAEGVGLRPGTPASGRYLGERVAYLRDGKWPPGTLDSTEVVLLLDRKTQTIVMNTADFKGGDFGRAFYAGDEGETRDFIHSLYGRCNAYLFLVDPGALKSASLPSATRIDQDQRERCIQSIVIALGMLKNTLIPFHKPVAIAFTKTDLHPDVTADPEAFARKHLAQADDYLRRFAPSRRFFAISATGNIGMTPDGPSEPLKPSGLLDPILWCAEQHRVWIKKRNLVAFICCFLTLMAGYGILLHHNAKYIRSIDQEAKTANYDELTKLFSETRTLEGLNSYTLTHPIKKTRLRQDIADQAEAWRKKYDWEPREDPTTHGIRTAEDWSTIFDQITHFAADFSGTENPSHLDTWINDQKEKLAMRLADAIKNAAHEGNEQQYDELVGEYGPIATKSANVRLAEARAELGRSILHNELRPIWDIRRNSPEDRKSVRGHCQTAEDVVQKWLLPEDERSVIYLRTVRRAYDRDQGCQFSIQLSADTDRPLNSLTIQVNGTNFAPPRGKTPMDPLDDNMYGFAIDGNVDSLSLRSNSAISIWIENNGFRNHHGNWNGTMNDLLTSGSASFPATAFIAGTDTYRVKVINSNDLSSVIKDNEDMPKLEAELFEAKHE